MRQLVERLAEYGKRCARTAESGLQAAPRRELERTHEFNAVVRAAAQACPRYASAISRVDSTGLGPADLLDCRNHVSAFLERSGFYRDCPVPAEGATRFADSLAAEASRQTCNITNLVLLNGLELSAKEVVFSAGRLVELDDKMLRRFVDGNAIPGPIASQSLNGVAALETTLAAPAPPWGPTRFEWGSTRQLVSRMSQPWLNYLNLFDADKCRAIGMYQRSDSLLHNDPVRAVGVEERRRADFLTNPRTFALPTRHLRRGASV